MKCGPEECPIVAFSDLTPAEQRVERKRKAQIMVEQGFTERQIAKQFGVSKTTINADLADWSVSDQSKSAKSTRNPKGSGRPRGRKQDQPGVEQAQRSVNTTPEEWEQFKKKAIEEGYGSAAAKLGELIAEPQIARADLSLTAQQKLDAAMRQHKARIDATFHDEVNKRVREFLEETILPRHREEQAQAKRVMDARKGIMDKATFRLIWSALHPDSRKSISDKKLAEAFDAFSGMEKLLLAEKESPTGYTPLPKSMADWDRMKAAAAASRRAKRSSTSTLRPR